MNAITTTPAGKTSVTTGGISFDHNVQANGNAGAMLPVRDTDAEIFEDL